MDNLFTSNELFFYFRELGHAAISTCRTNSGVVSELVELKRKDRSKDQIE
jgi:hypothetical protein